MFEFKWMNGELNTPTVSFYLRKERLLKSGKTKFALRVGVDSERGKMNSGGIIAHFTAASIEQAQKAAQDFLEEYFFNCFKKEKQMYIGVIYNWKGLKEENYLYTLDEMALLDFDLLSDCIAHRGEFNPAASECAWKTWEGRLLCDDDEIKMFLEGCWNDEEQMDPNFEYYSEDWYWANQIQNGLYGENSDTMKYALKKFNITKNIQ